MISSSNSTQRSQTTSQAKSIERKANSFSSKLSRFSSPRPGSDRLASAVRISDEAAQAGKPQAPKENSAPSKNDKVEKADQASELQSIKEQLAKIEKELAELKAEFLKDKEEQQEKKAEKSQAAGGGSASGSASDKGPTVMNPEAPAGFLWKPVSDSDGKLAILLPPNMTGKVQGVSVTDPQGQVLASGRGGGVGNGGREHFRFDRPGGNFPSGSKVRIQMKSGQTQEITIQQTGIRNEGGKKG